MTTRLRVLLRYSGDFLFERAVDESNLPIGSAGRLLDDDARRALIDDALDVVPVADDAGEPVAAAVDVGDALVGV